MFDSLNRATGWVSSRQTAMRSGAFFQHSTECGSDIAVIMVLMILRTQPPCAGRLHSEFVLQMTLVGWPISSLETSESCS